MIIIIIAVALTVTIQELGCLVNKDFGARVQNLKVATQAVIPRRQAFQPPLCFQLTRRLHHLLSLLW